MGRLPRFARRRGRADRSRRPPRRRPRVRSSKGRHNRRICLEKFSFSVVFESLSTIYDEIVSAKAGATRKAVSRPATEASEGLARRRGAAMRMPYRWVVLREQKTAGALSTAGPVLLPVLFRKARRASAYDAASGPRDLLPSSHPRRDCDLGRHPRIGASNVRRRFLFERVGGSWSGDRGPPRRKGPARGPSRHRFDAPPRPQPPPVVHVNCCVSPLGVWRDLLVTTLVRVCRVPVVVHYHGSLPTS